MIFLDFIYAPSQINLNTEFKNMLILEKGVFKSCHWSMSGCKIYTFSMAENRKKYLSNKKNCVIVWNSICFGYQSMVRVRTRVTL